MGPFDQSLPASTICSGTRAADERKAFAERSRGNFGTGCSTPCLKATGVSGLIDRFEPLRRRTVLFFLYGQMDK